jgi:predicted ATP-grasp superfamily ATP-dependent carboligase
VARERRLSATRAKLDFPKTGLRAGATKRRDFYNPKMQTEGGQGPYRSVAAVVLGHGINALGVVRSLGRHGIPVFVADPAAQDIAYRSRYARHASIPGYADPEAQVAALLDLADRLGDRPMLVPTSDRALRLLVRFRDRLRAGFRFRLADDTAIRTVLDKGEFSRFTREHDLPAPAGHVPRTLAETEALARTISYPVVLKPTLSFAWERHGRGVERARSPEELLRHWTARSGDALLIQEMIEGGDDQHFSFCVYRDAAGRELAAILVNKIRVFPVGGGAGTFLRVVRDDAMEEIGRFVLDRLGFVGAASVCFKKDAKSGRPLMHEINGRLPQWHGVFQACGVDLPRLIYRDVMGETVAPSPMCPAGTSFVLFESDVLALGGYRRSRQWSLWRWLGSYRGLGGIAEFAWDDRKPFYFVMRRMLRAVGRRLVRVVAPPRGAVPATAGGAKGPA